MKIPENNFPSEIFDRYPQSHFRKERLWNRKQGTLFPVVFFIKSCGEHLFPVLMEKSFS